MESRFPDCYMPTHWREATKHGMACTWAASPPRFACAAFRRRASRANSSAAYSGRRCADDLPKPRVRMPHAAPLGHGITAATG